MLSDMTSLGEGPTPKRARLHTADEGPSAFNRWAIVFDPIVSRLLVNLPGKSESFCRGLCEELYRCLIVKSRASDPMALSVPPLVDMAWHEAILNTRRYMMLCDALGGYIHHTTDTIEDAQLIKKKRLEDMREAYRLVWGMKPQSAYWGEVESDVCLDDEDDILAVSSTRPSSDNGMEAEVLTIEFGDAAVGLSCWMRMTAFTKMIKAMNAYYRRNGIIARSHKFLFDGRMLVSDDTPSQLGMKSGDFVLCYIPQLGC